jgi:hypothetical protein
VAAVLNTWRAIKLYKHGWSICDLCWKHSSAGNIICRSPLQPSVKRLDDDTNELFGLQACLQGPKGKTRVA